VMWINRRNRVCQIQPGVTYGELLKALAPHGMTISMPLSPRDGKSVVAAIMDREPVTWANRQWDISDPVASTEFIFGNGELFRTGAAGGPGTIEQQRSVGGAQKYSGGPSQTEFNRVLQGSQGTMGIVSWITVRCELAPSVQRTCLLGSDNLEPLIGYMYEVQRPWLGEHSFILDRTGAAMLLSGTGHGDFGSIRDGLPGYVCLQNIAGFERLPRERVAYQEGDIGDIAKRHGLSLKESLGPVRASDLLLTATRPCGGKDWRDQRTGACLSVFFLTTLDRVPGLIRIYGDELKKAGLDGQTTGVYVQPIVQNHGCHVELMTCYDPGDAGLVDRIKALEKDAVTALTDGGAFFSRPYGTAGDVVFGKNPLNFDLIRKVKAIFDPNRVLNRGKWGL